MANGNYACFTCRRTYRQGLRCPGCRGSLEYLGTKWRPPARADHQAWAEASRAHSRRMASANRDRHQRELLLLSMHSVADEVRRLQRKPALTRGEQARLAVLLWHEGKGRQRSI